MSSLRVLTIENPQFLHAETGQCKRDRLANPASADHSNRTMRGGGDEPTDSLRKAGRVGVVTGQSSVVYDDGVDRTNQFSARR